MIIIRDYRESDAASVGVLIADTYSEFNLSFATPENKKKLLGPFYYARSEQKARQEEIARVIRADMVFVAERDGEIVAVLRGSVDKLRSLFVRADQQRQGIGRKIVEHFEDECRKRGSGVVRLASTLYAVPFYASLGYKRSTGVRVGRSFEGTGLKYQPMKKAL
jgi:GNAT superfamily N-acetyltransferase